MMIGGFYAMWNGMGPRHIPEFETMHAREHLAAHVAYLGPDAILAGRRHSGGVGSLPPFFTCYDMRALDVLTASDRQNRRVADSAGFMKFRSHYRDHIRHHCRVLAHRGVGLGGAVGTVLMRLTEGVASDAVLAVRLCDSLVKRAPITSARLGLADPTLPTLVGGAPPPRAAEEEPVGVLIVEGYARYALAAELPRLVDRLCEEGVARDEPRWAHYDLSFAVSYAEAADFVSAG